MSEPERISPVHPGKIIDDDVLKPLGMSQNELATRLGVPANRINAIVRGLRSISADTALRLSRFLGTTPEFWISLQMYYDLDVAKDELAATLERDVDVLRWRERLSTRETEKLSASNHTLEGQDPVR